MTTIGIRSELDAAEALLELQRDNRTIKFEPSCRKGFKENSLPMATFLYNLIDSKSSLGAGPTITSTPKSSPSANNVRKSEPSCLYDTKNTKPYGMHNLTEIPCKPHDKGNNNNLKCKVPKQEAIITKVWADSINDKLVRVTNQSKITHNKATQTEIEYQMPEIEKMENIIRGLCSKIAALENRLKNQNSEPSLRIDSMNDFNTDISNESRSMRTGLDRNERRSLKRKRSSTINTDVVDCNSTSANSTYAILSNEDTESDKEYSNESKILKSNNRLKQGKKMISIGDGNAIVPSKLIKNMDWSSYTNATRKLLTAVFSRKVLATHSLTGKPSPAFPDKPAKKKLNSSLVNDIVQTVVERCHVPESVVRTSITTKCADESKMFRSRQQNKKKRVSNKRNRENLPPFNCVSDCSSDSYSSS